MVPISWCGGYSQIHVYADGDMYGVSDYRMGRVSLPWSQLKSP